MYCHHYLRGSLHRNKGDTCVPGAVTSFKKKMKPLYYKFDRFSLYRQRLMSKQNTQPIFACLKSTIETLEKRLNYVQS